MWVCGLKDHPRSNCPAGRSTCLKGHWAAACKSTVATVASDDNEQIDSVLWSVKTTNEVTRSPNGVYENDSSS